MTEEKIVTLNSDQKEVINRRTKDAFFALKQLAEWVEQDSLTEEMKETLPKLIDSHLEKIKEQIGFSGEESEREKEMTESITNHLHSRIKELEAMVNSNSNLLSTKQQLDSISKALDKWWDSEGFNYISELSFTKAGNVRVKFGFMLENIMLGFSDTPDSDAKDAKRKIEIFKEQGFEFIKDNHNSDKKLRFCDKNIKLLSDMIKEKFPTALITTWENHCYRNKEEDFYIRSFEVIIYDYSELENIM